MSREKKPSDSLLRLILEKKHQIQRDKLKEQHDEEKFQWRLDSLEAERRHKQQLELAAERAKSEALSGALEKLLSTGVAAPATAPTSGTPESSSAALPISDAPMLSEVIGDYLARYPARKADMLKKHRTVLPVFLDVVGDRRVSELRQADLIDFFDTVQALPPRWKDEIRKRKCSIRELAAVGHEKEMGPKTFKDTYRASLRLFLASSRTRYQDQGFPTTLTTDGIVYEGDREAGDQKQRAFKADELKRLFEGQEMRVFASDPRLAHQCWLPLIGLFTGARVNEICQINPQTDIIEEDGIWCFWFTDETETHERAEKSIKNNPSRRKVPVHSKLIELGFLKYAKRVRKRGSLLLFPDWPPSKKKASGAAEKWFRNFLTEIDLRDETPGARLVGMHSFRHTILNRALNLEISGMNHITGHAHTNGEEKKSAVVLGYEGQLYIKNKQRILERLTFDIEFIKPTTE